MSKLTAEVIAMEMDKFEALHPVPKYTSRCGNGYAVSEFNAWDGHSYCHMWKGWISRAEMALPVLEQKNKCWTYIRFMDRSKSQCMKCKVTFTDGFNSLIYDEEGCPLLVANNSFEFINLNPSTTPQIDNDGWIEWRGGKQPIANDRELAIKFRDGTVMTETHSDCWVWSHGGDDDDIIAYRVIENDGSK